MDKTKLEHFKAKLVKEQKELEDTERKFEEWGRRGDHGCSSY